MPVSRFKIGRPVPIQRKGGARMDTGWVELIQTLKNESTAVAELSALGTRKRQAIQGLDLAALEEANAREEVKVMQLRELGDARRAILERLLPAEACAPEHQRTLREAIVLMPASVQEEVRQLRQKLLDQVRELGQITQGNTELLRQSIDRVDGLVQILLGGGEREATYQVKGRHVMKTGAAVMDREG